MGDLRCEVTGNPCGTDTWSAEPGLGCRCEKCVACRDVEIDRLRNALAQQNSAENKHSYAVLEAVRRLPDELRAQAIKIDRFSRATYYSGRSSGLRSAATQVNCAIVQHSEPGRVPERKDDSDAPPYFDIAESLAWASGWNACRDFMLAATPAPDADERE